MTARPFVANVVKIEYFGTTGFYNWAVIHHCNWSGASPSVAALDSFATTLGTLWGTDMKAEYGSALFLNTVTITDLTNALGNQGVASPNIAGTAASANTAQNAAILVNYPSSIRYRGGHPRSYYPGAASNTLADDTHWNSTLITNVGTYLTALQNDYNTLTSGGTTLAGQCAVSYVTAGAPRVTPLVMNIAPGSYTVEARIASQRRRIGRK